MRDLEKDKEICDRATPGPWIQDRCNVSAQGYTLFITYVSGKNDAQFIAQAREGWPHAIERAITAEEKLSKIHEVFKYRRCKNCLHYHNPVCPMDDVVIEDDLTDESYCSWFCAKAEQTDKEGEK